MIPSIVSIKKFNMKIFDKVFEYLDNKKNIKLLRSFGLVLSCISIAIIFDTFKKYELNLNNFKLNVLLISFFLMMTSYVFLDLHGQNI